MADGDTVTLDVERDEPHGDHRHGHNHQDVVVEMGGKANPPGFDDQIRGLEVGAEKSFTLHYPEDYAVKEMANTDVNYKVKVKDMLAEVSKELGDTISIARFHRFQFGA